VDSIIIAYENLESFRSIETGGICEVSVML